MDSNEACARCGKDPAEGWAVIGGKRYCHGEESPSCYMRMMERQWGKPIRYLEPIE